MPTGCYSFTRSKSIEGLFSKNRESTDALSALDEWSSKQTERRFEILEDNETLLARLSWSESDKNARQDLNNACLRCGVERLFCDKRGEAGQGGLFPGL